MTHSECRKARRDTNIGTGDHERGDAMKPANLTSKLNYTPKAA